MSNRPICNVDTPDPWIIAANGKFYLTFTLDNRIEIWESEHLEDFNNCRKSNIWQPAPGSPWSANIWAPELHWLNGQWYIYTCAAPPDIGNPGHRTVILRSLQPDPMDPAGWQFLGPVQGMPDHWAIDATVFSPNGSDLYCCWSGWPLGDHSDTQQDLFLIKMASPELAIADTLLCISRADQHWERPDDGKRGVNEGPTWVNFPGFRGIVYSAHGSWTSDYKLGLLALVGQDPLRPDSWVKRAAPLLVSGQPHQGGPFGPGHASFLSSPCNDGRIFCIYHGTEKYGEGWANRKARIISLGPECFAAHAQPVCCGLMGASQGYGNGGQGGESKFGDKFDKLTAKAPDQLKGVLGGLKKFF